MMQTSTPHWLKYNARQALRMAASYRYSGNMRMAIAYQERAADYRATAIDIMRRRQGWTLVEIVAGIQG